MQQAIFLNPFAVQQRSSLRRPVQALLAAYVVFILYATTLPFQFTLDGPTLAAKRHWINWDPTHLVTGEPTPLADLVSNVMFFVPLGVLAWFLLKGRGTKKSIALCTALGFFLSLGVESLQFFTPSRNPATSDLITNTLGAFLGAVGAALFAWRTGGVVLMHTKRLARSEPLVVLVVGTVVWLALRALVPLDISFAINEIKHSVRGARLLPSGSLGSLAGDVPDVVSYALASGLAFVALGRLRRQSIFLRYLSCALGAGFLALGLEMCQLLIRSRVADTHDVITAMVGGFLGPAVAMLLVRGPVTAAVWGSVACLYALGLGIAGLEPFKFEFDAETIRSKLDARLFMPYYTHYFRAPIAAVNEFLDGLLLYMPLGFLLARQAAVRWAGTTTLRIGAAAALGCALLAFVLELLQLGLPARYADVSDLVTAAMGGSLGGFSWVWFEQLRAVEPEPMVLRPLSRSAPNFVSTSSEERLRGQNTLNAPTSS